MKRVAEKAHGATFGEGERDNTDEYGAAHDERERRIPQTGEIEKPDDLGRVRHARDDQSDAENQTHDKLGEATHHAFTRRCRITKTMKNPAPMKATVATKDRGDNRDSPQTPCPLVQPAP